MSRLIRVLILDALPESRQLTTTMIEFDPEMVVVGHVAALDDLFQVLDASQPDIVLVADPTPGEEMPKVVWQITSRVRHVGVIVISAHTSPEAMRRCMVAGARGFVSRPLDTHELRATIRDVYARLYEEELARARQLTPPTTPLIQASPSVLGHIVAVFGAKGGVGKTTVAVNLAVGLRQSVSRNVALFDADLSLGDAGLCLDLAPVHTILDLVEAIDREPEGQMDAEFIKGVMARYEPLGLRVLLGPPRPEHAELVSAAHLDRVLREFRRLFDYTVVDCPVGYDERVLTILDHADQILFLVTPEVGSLKNARNFLDLSEALGYPREAVQIVLNRANSQVSITPDDVQRWLAYPVSHKLVSGGAAVAEAANRGRPLIHQNPQHAVSRNIIELVEAVRQFASLPRQTGRIRSHETGG